MNCSLLIRLLDFRTLLLAIILSLICCTNENSKPKLDIKPNIINLLSLSPEDSIIEVHLINIGQEKIRISEIRSVCGCMNLTISDSIIEIGELSKLFITNSATINDGLSRPVTIYSNAMNNPHKIWLISE